MPAGPTDDNASLDSGPPCVPSAAEILRGARKLNAGLIEIFEYNRWATATLLDACRQLSSEILGTRVNGVSGTIVELLVHLVGAQQTFVLRTKGRQHEGELNRSSAFPGFDELARLADESNAQLVEVARRLEDDATVDLPWGGKAYRFPVRFFLVHAMEHAMEHSHGAQGGSRPARDTDPGP